MYQMKSHTCPALVAHRGHLHADSEKALYVRSPEKPALPLRPQLHAEPKPRLRWAPELHEHFIDAVKQLGGPDKATPKALMKFMDVKGLTLYHLKSHLQKYRLGLHLNNKDGSDLREDGSSEDHLQTVESRDTATSSTVSNLEINRTLAVQLKVQRQLQEQLEIQKKLQVQIEAQSKHLQFLLEKTRETLTGHVAALPCLKAGKTQFIDLTTKVSLESYSSLLGLESSLPGSPPLLGAEQHPHFTDLPPKFKPARLAITENHKRSNSDYQEMPPKKVKAFFCDNNGRIWRNDDGGAAKLHEFPCRSQKDATEERLAKGSKIRPTHNSFSEVSVSYDQSLDEDDGDSTCHSIRTLKEDCQISNMPVDIVDDFTC